MPIISGQYQRLLQLSTRGDPQRLAALASSSSATLSAWPRSNSSLLLELARATDRRRLFAAQVAAAIFERHRLMARRIMELGWTEVMQQHNEKQEFPQSSSSNLSIALDGRVHCLPGSGGTCTDARRLSGGPAWQREKIERRLVCVMRRVRRSSCLIKKHKGLSQATS